MKKILSLVFAASLLVLFGCTKNGTATPAPDTTTTTPADQPEISERQTYESKNDGFVIQYPGTRTFQENVYSASVMFFTPITEWDQIRENIGIMTGTLDKEYTINEYFDAMIKPALNERITSFKEISNESIKINDIDAKKILYTSRNNDITIQYMSIYLIKNTTLYTITYTATESTFNEFLQKAEEMAATLEVK